MDVSIRGLTSSRYMARSSKWCPRVRTGLSRPSLPRLWRLDNQAQPVAGARFWQSTPGGQTKFPGNQSSPTWHPPDCAVPSRPHLRPTGRDRRSVPKLATSETIRDSTCLVFAKARVWERLCQAGAFVMTPIHAGIADMPSCTGVRVPRPSGSAESRTGRAVSCRSSRIPGLQRTRLQGRRRERQANPATATCGPSLQSLDQCAQLLSAKGTSWDLRSPINLPN